MGSSSSVASREVSSSPVGGRGATSSSHSASTIMVDAVEGSHDLKIQGYSRTKGLGTGMCITSETFAVGGHDWCIKYYPDGFESKDAGWISFFLRLENSSATEVKASTRFTLLDEMGEPVPSYHKDTGILCTFKNIESIRGYWGFPQFIERKALEKSCYLKDDSFRVRCDVTVLQEFGAQNTKKNQFVTVPPPDMHQHIGRLLLTGASSQVEADVTFQIGTETVTAHRPVLAARSPVFMAQLFGPMKENGTSHIKIEEMDAAVFKAMLHFIYTDSFPDVDKEEELPVAQNLLVAADRYDIQRLKLMCEDKLCHCVGTSTVATYLWLAELHGCPGLKAACFEFLKSPGNLNAIMQSDGFQQLTSSYPSLLKQLVAKLAP